MPQVERERRAAAAMVGVPGFVVLAMSDHDGEFEQAIEPTADLVGRRAAHRRPCWVRDLPTAGRPATLVGIERVWRCPHPLCPERTRTETSTAIGSASFGSPRCCPRLPARSGPWGGHDALHPFVRLTFRRVVATDGQVRY